GGGGEERGGMGGVKHYMQRTALQGSPRVLAAITHRYMPGAPITSGEHPFRRKFHDLPIGYQLKTKAREITLDDIEHFAHFTGDTFYAHMDEEAAKANPLFGGRVAHGYLILSFAAGVLARPRPRPSVSHHRL